MTSRVGRLLSGVVVAEWNSSEATTKAVKARKIKEIEVFSELDGMLHGAGNQRAVRYAAPKDIRHVRSR